MKRSPHHSWPSASGTYIRYATAKANHIRQILSGEIAHPTEECAKVHIECRHLDGQRLAHYVAIHLQRNVILVALHGHIVPFQVVQSLLFG